MANLYFDPRTGRTGKGSARIANIKMLIGTAASPFLFLVVGNFMEPSWYRSIILFVLGSWTILSLFGLFEVWKNDHWFRSSNKVDPEPYGINSRLTSPARSASAKHQSGTLDTSAQLTRHLSEMGFVIFLSEKAANQLRCEDEFEPWEHVPSLAKIMACADQYSFMTEMLRNAATGSPDLALLAAKEEGLQVADENLKSMIEEIEIFREGYEKSFSPNTFNDALLEAPRQIEILRSEIVERFG